MTASTLAVTLLVVLDDIVLAMLGVAFVLAVTRIIRNGSLADKMLGADTLTTIVASAVVAATVVADTPYYLDVAVIIGGLGFVGTLTVARFIEQRGTGAEDLRRQR